MKEYFDVNGIVGNIYYGLFQHELDELQKQRPFLRCNQLMSAEQAAIFLLEIKNEFGLSEDVIHIITASEKFSFYDICNRILYALNEK